MINPAHLSIGKKSVTECYFEYFNDFFWIAKWKKKSNTNSLLQCEWLCNYVSVLYDKSWMNLEVFVGLVSRKKPPFNAFVKSKCNWTFLCQIADFAFNSMYQFKLEKKSGSKRLIIIRLMHNVGCNQKPLKYYTQFLSNILIPQSEFWLKMTCTVK